MELLVCLFVSLLFFFCLVSSVDKQEKKVNKLRDRVFQNKTTLKPL